MVGDYGPSWMASQSVPRRETAGKLTVHTDKQTGIVMGSYMHLWHADEQSAIMGCSDCCDSLNMTKIIIL